MRIWTLFTIIMVVVITGVVGISVMLSSLLTRDVEWLEGQRIAVTDATTVSYYTIGFRADGVVVWDKDKKFTTWRNVDKQPAQGKKKRGRKR